VVGGETGSNAPAQPNLEIIPQIPGGDTVLEMDWLLRTNPYNLYPFLVVLPSGRVFVGEFSVSRSLRSAGLKHEDKVTTTKLGFLTSIHLQPSFRYPIFLDR
jgi:hypothetical protein